MNNEVTIEFLDDYAYCFLSTQQFMNALYVMDMIAKFSGISIEKHRYYKMLSENLVTYSKKDSLDKSDIWKVTDADIDGMYYFDCPLMGMSFAVDGETKVIFTGIEPFSSVSVVFKPESFTVENNKIGMSAVVSAVPQCILSETYEKDMLKKFNIVNESTVNYRKNKFKVYTYDNPKIYNDIRGGSYGYVFFTTVKPSEYSGVHCEHAVDFAKMKNGTAGIRSDDPKYYLMKPTYRRMNEPITYCIVIDSCNAILEETNEWVKDFFINAVFE